MYNQYAKSSASKDPYNFSMEPAAPTSKPTPKQGPQSKIEQTKVSKPTKSKSKMLSSNFQPKRFGLRYDPPAIILEYLSPDVGQLYHHKIKLLKMKVDTPTHHVIEYIKKKHYQYFQGNKIPDSQLTLLIEKMKSRMKNIPTTKKDERPNTASTMASSKSQMPNPNTKGSSIPAKLQKQIGKEFDDYGMGGQSSTKTQNQPNLKQMVKGPEPQEDEDYEEEYEEEYEDGEDGIQNSNQLEYYEGEEEDEEGEEGEIDEDEYKRIYEKMNYNDLDMNKLSNEELNEHKAIMDQIYKKNIKRPGDSGYQYDKQEQFKPTKDTEWDDD